MPKRGLFRWLVSAMLGPRSGGHGTTVERFERRTRHDVCARPRSRARPVGVKCCFIPPRRSFARLCPDMGGATPNRARQREASSRVE